MPKGQAKETYKDIKGSRGLSEIEYGRARQESRDRLNEGPTNPLRNELLSGYRNLSYSPVSAERVSTENFKPSFEGFNEMGRTGGLNDEAIQRMRGMGGFDEYAKTGGYSDADRANIRSRALSPIGSFASSARDELARRRSVQGGYSPGFDASSRAIRRDASRGIADASLNAELGIMDRVNEGRRWGIGGLTDAEGRLQTLKTGNQLAGWQGSLGAATGMADVETGNANRALNAGMFNSDMGLRTDLAGLGGISDIYGSDIGMREREIDRDLGLLDSQNRNRLGNLGLQTQLAIQPGAAGQILQGVGSAIGAIPWGKFTGGGNTGFTGGYGGYTTDMEGLGGFGRYPGYGGVFR